MADFPGLSVGQRVRFPTDTDRYPHFVIPAGREGTITSIEWGVVIKVDGPDVPGLHDGEWEGEFMWSPDDECWFNGEDYPERPWPGRDFVVVDPIDGHEIVDAFGKGIA